MLIVAQGGCVDRDRADQFCELSASYGTKPGQKPLPLWGTLALQPGPRFQQIGDGDGGESPIPDKSWDALAFLQGIVTRSGSCVTPAADCGVWRVLSRRRNSPQLGDQPKSGTTRRNIIVYYCPDSVGRAY
jgi:hypothetical protein